jgi:ribosomal protein S12 methylthiotransferase
VTPPTQTETTGVLETRSTPQAKPRVGFVSLGCPKNLVDSEVMMGLLHHNGAELTPRAEDAEIIVINTCSFIDSAKQESVNTILEMVQHKQQNGGKAQRIVVAGCLVERYRDEIQKNIPEVDAVVGTGELEAILAAAGLTPTGHAKSDSPFNILPQGTPEKTIHTHAISMAETNNEVSHLIERAPSAVSQHSRPLADPEHDNEIAPQLKIVQSLAETGTTHGDEPLAHSGDHIAHIPNAGTKSRAEGDLQFPEDSSVPKLASRLEGDLREQQGRFSRASWDGATAALPEYLYNDATPRILTTPRASAYIKIAEGCDHPCSFCIIPQLRGKFRSRRMSSIIAEAENLIKQGVREITLIGQDTTCYGEDLGFTDGLATLLDALTVLPGLRWLRFLYTYPNKVTTRLLETMAKHSTIAKYLDVPLQHASPSVLKRMKRGGNAQIFLDLISKARRIVPGIVIRTSFIVGFPGETEADYLELEAFIKAAKIDWLGVFTYSDEEGAKAFELADDLKVPTRTIQSRRRKLMKLQQKISTKSKAEWVGREIDLLVEGESEETELLWEGRTPLHAPEIDGKVLINDFGPHEALVPGTFYRAEITESHDYDVVARILE